MTTKKLNKIYNEEKKIEKPKTNITFNEVKVTPNRKDNFRTTPNKLIDILHADISVKFNWGLHQCIGVEKIILKPYFYETDSILLDAKNMVFDGIKIIDAQQNELQYLVQYDKKVLNLKLEKKLKATDTVTLILNYIAKPDENEKAAGKAIRDDKGLYFINTDNAEPNKPIQIWTQGETESNSHWYPTIDKPNEKFTSTLSIEVNKDFTTLSNGELVSSTIEENAKIDIWKNELPMPAYLMMMAIGNFDITKEEWNGKEVSYYLEPSYSPFAKNIFANTKEMLQFFSDKLGVTYPWNKYAQVVVRDYVSGAMENTSATLHGEFVQKNNRELLDSDNDGIIAHEMFHQWFGDLVTCESWSHVTLNEGFASYGEQLWIEHKDGKDAALKKCYQTIEKYLKYTKDNEDGPIINYNYKTPDDMFNSLTYQKSSRVLHLLRTELGDDAFFLALKNYLINNAFGNAEIDDLRKEFEHVSGKDLRPFFQQWFLQGGHPIIEIRYDYNDTTQLMGVSIEQKQVADFGVFKFPLKFKLTQGDETRYFNFNIEKRKETFFVQKFDGSFQSYPNVVVDPDATFLGEIKDNKPFFNYVLTYNNASSYVEKMRALKEMSIQQKQYDTARFTILSAINDADEDIRLFALQNVDWTNPQNIFKTKEILLYLSKNDASASVRAQVVKVLGNMKDTTLLSHFVSLTQDSSYSVAGESLNAVRNVSPTQALELAMELQVDARGILFDEISNTFKMLGNQNSLSFFKDNLMKVFKINRAKLIENYNFLLLNLKIENEMDEAINTFKIRASTDQSAIVRYQAMKALSDMLKYKKDAVKQPIDETLREKYKVEIPILENELQQTMLAETDNDVINKLKLAGLYLEAKP